MERYLAKIPLRTLSCMICSEQKIPLLFCPTPEQKLSLRKSLTHKKFSPHDINHCRKPSKTTSSSFSRQNQPTREAQLLLVQHVVYYSRMLSFLHWDEMGRFTRASVLTHFETCIALYYCGRKLKCKAKLKWYLRAFLVVFLN